MENRKSFPKFAGMKAKPFVIGLLVLLALAACAPKNNDDAVETWRAASLQITVSPELSAIDSLMWRQPDSALMRLIPYFDTCGDVSRNLSANINDTLVGDVSRNVSTSGMTPGTYVLRLINGDNVMTQKIVIR